MLLYGSLPDIILNTSNEDRESDLESYVINYLEEEIRKEALVRNIGPFARFLELAALESGGLLNLSKMSQEIGVSTMTIQSYYSILSDCLVGCRIDPITQSSTRKRLSQASCYLMFDLGVRRVAAREGLKPSPERMGAYFEQWVGLEILRFLKQYFKRSQLRYWRDLNGPEVDWVIDHQENLIPIEVKWTDTPKEKHARHLKTFLNEYPNSSKGYIVCRTPNTFEIDTNIYAIPWQQLLSIFEL